MAAKRILKDSEFMAIMADFGWSEENQLIAKKVLVNGLSVAHVAKHFAKSRQYVNTLTQKAWQKFIEQSPIPEGWDRIVVELPETMANEIMQKSYELKENIILNQELKKE